MRRFELYLAAPFFSEGERAFNEIVLRELEPSWSVFYPYRDGVRMAELVAEGVDPGTAARQVWLCDVERIRDCHGVVAVLDGRVPDEGVCVELGLASALGKAVIGLVTDTRACFRWGANPMITGCLTTLCDELTKLSGDVTRFIGVRHPSKLPEEAILTLTTARTLHEIRAIP